MGKILFYAKKAIKWSLKQKGPALLLTPITSAYFLILDVWGDSFAFIKNNLEVHQLIFIALLGLSLIGWVLRSAIDEDDNKEEMYAKEVLLKFIKHIGIIVQRKKDRFSDKLLAANSATDKFAYITEPQKQIKDIFQQVQQFLIETFGIQENQINASVFEESQSDQKWKLFVDLQGWEHPNFADLLSKNSTGKSCLESGESIFYPCKNEAAKRSEYFLDFRDKKRKEGSAYVAPVFCVDETYTHRYVVSFITYGVRLCDPWDTEGTLLVQNILDEFSRRVKLELCLHTFKKLHLISNGGSSGQTAAAA